MLIKTGQTLVFVGDSITAAGRDRPDLAPLGGGYVRSLQNLLTVLHPEVKLVMYNGGFNGDTSRDLARNWGAQVLARKANWVTVLIGVNDTWRDYDGHPQLAVHADEYAATLDRLLSQAEAQGARSILMAPYLVEPNRNDPMRRGVEMLAARLPALAQKHNAVFVPLQPKFDVAMKNTPSNLWSLDRVHPTDLGATLIALEWLRAVGAITVPA